MHLKKISLFSSKNSIAGSGMGRGPRVRGSFFMVVIFLMNRMWILGHLVLLVSSFFRSIMLRLFGISYQVVQFL
jgi:hypothetical protein